MQTPHYFYNPDIFQRNLRVGEEVKNEQALFFRGLQAGRDTRNSAFFAGSGRRRRKPLMEIGGFQTQTITEDTHTSMSEAAWKACPAPASAPSFPDLRKIPWPAPCWNFPESR